MTERIYSVDSYARQMQANVVGVDPDDGSELWRVDVPTFRGMNILTPTVVGNRIFATAVARMSSFWFVIVTESVASGRPDGSSW